MRGSIVFMVIAAMALIQGRQGKVLREGDRVVFFGDSITEQGAKPKGYISLVKDSLSAAFKTIEVIGAGISGHRVPDLQMRVGRDVIAKKPTVVVIYIGINDVWHFSLNGKGTPKEHFQSGLQWLADTLGATGSRVVLCTPSVVGEQRNGENPLDPMLNEYAEIIRGIAHKRGLTLCDLREAFFEYLGRHNHENLGSGVLTYDKVHLSDEGNRLVAKTLLKVLR